MKTPDQVAGEAREKLADKIDCWAAMYGSAYGMTLHLTGEELAAVRAALRAQPERGAEEMRPAIHAWIREDVPLAGKMNLFPEHVDALIAKLRALPLHPAKDDGWGR